MSKPHPLACPKAMKALTKSIADHQWPYKDEPDMLQMFTQDRKDLRRVRKFCWQGKWAEAREKVYSMDTAVRELIPNTLWNHITE